MDHDDAMRMLEAITTAFDAHDLDGIMAHFADDAVFDGPRGTDPWGTRFVGAAEIREGFAARFAGIPDIRYTEDEHHDRRSTDRGPRLRSLDLPRREGREEGFLLEDPDAGLAGS